MENSAHNRGHSKKLFASGQNGCCSASDESDCEPDGHRRHIDDDLVNQYERIGDRSSGTSTGSSGLSGHKPTAPKATHYAESAIYKRSRGYPSPDSETSTLPANYGPTPVAQYLLNRVAGISASNASGGASSGGMNSSEPWPSSAIGCHTLERNIDSSCNNKNNNKIANNLLSSSVHHLLSSSAGVDTIGNSCGPLIDAQRGGDYDPATTCLVRTQSGSLFIPTDFGDRDAATTCLVRTQTGSRFIAGDASNKANPLQASNDFDRMLSSHHHSIAPIIKCDTTGKSVLGDRSMILASNAGRLATRTAPMSVRKTLSAHCNWKCAAITFIFVSIALLFAICCFLGVYMSAESDQTHVCPVMMVETELNPNASDRKKAVNSKQPIAAKSHEDDMAAKLNFMEVKLGKTHSQRVPSYGHWNVQLVQKEPTLVKFNYTIPAGVTVGVYGGKNRIPSHTKYDFMEVIGISSPSSPILRMTRSNHVNSRKLQTAEFIQFLDRGNWYITIYNDESQPQEISFVTLIADESNIRCPNECNGHGTCVMGTCKCEADYSGDTCEHRVCPIFCSGRGKYVKGQCVCNNGWKGKECELREEECEVSDCSGHGDCVDGVCHCFPGYKGQHCEEVDCLDPDCSGHGVCVNGMCLCGKGWKGAHCNEPDSNALRCLPDCSGHGSFDLDSQQCMCDSRWMGADCSQERCDLDCGVNGHCQSGECLCSSGWTGSKCEERFCDPRCLEHGQCKNGTCFCSQGWNGKHCTLEGCPRNCNNRGECVERDNEWECECNPNWTGHDCSIALEKDCNDRKDNDNDGLIDCADSECCAAKECTNNPLCFSSSDPLDILLRKQPPPATASFFQRMQFLIEENSVQSYAHKQAFNDSRASVIRGQVTSPSGSGLMGVRVGISNEPLLGFVVSRDTGWFDIMVNGGGAVTLHFQRDPFRPTQRTVMVPWNEIVVIDKVKMNVEERKLPDYRSPICVEHDYDSMRPLILGAWKHGFQGGCNQEKGSNEKTTTASSESQVVQEKIAITGTDIALVYHSSRAQGYMSTLGLQLTPDKVPSSLRQVHVKIAIEGNLFEKVFEGDPNIKYTYSWNRRNVYRQKVYGIAAAIVHVGYEYLNCPQIIWEVQAVKLGGFDMSISEIGGWNLNIHHRLNFHEAIIHKGSGNNIYLNNRPKILGVIMGDGQQRPLHCPYCNGFAKEQRLLAPVALASGPDGSVYVGDFNLIRRISSDGKVSTIIELSASQVAYKYHLTVSPFDGKLYISDPEKHQILRAITLVEPIHNPRNNLEVVVGSGVKCLPGNKNLCGDGRHARDARLAYPKGIAISLNNEMFIADGTNIRMVDNGGIIHTLIGDHYHKSHWKPFPCSGTIPLQKVNLRWPTELAINPLDNSLHILDDHMILKLTPDKRIRIVAGRPTHCSSVITAHEEASVNQESMAATQIFLETPQSISFSANGDLFVAESDSQMINRVRVVSNNGKMHRYAGVDLKCSCMETNCECFDGSDTLALNSKLSTISSIAVTPDGRLHICDQGNLRIRTVFAVTPRLNTNQEYEINDQNELYVFNRYGQHTATKSTTDGQTRYTFAYNDNTSSGKLSSVSDASGNKVFLLRDYTNQVKSIESAKSGQCRLTMSRGKLLHTFAAPNADKMTFTYYGNTGLLKSRSDSAETALIYNYDDNGRLKSAVTPNGEEVKLNYSLSSDGPCVKVMKGDNSQVTNTDSAALTPITLPSASRMRRVAPFGF